MKSMCHDSRRNSPSVAERSPISSCLRTISRWPRPRRRAARRRRCGRRRGPRAPAAAAAGGAGCRRGRRGTGARCVRSSESGLLGSRISAGRTPSRAHPAGARRSGSRRLAARHHRLVLGAVRIEVETGKPAFNRPRAKTSTSRRRASSGTRNANRPSPSVPQRPQPTPGSQSSSMASAIGASSPSNTCPRRGRCRPGSSFCGRTQRPNEEERPDGLGRRPHSSNGVRRRTMSHV